MVGIFKGLRENPNESAPQIMIKVVVGEARDSQATSTNISGGPTYNQAPVFVFLRQPARTDPAVVQIP